MYIYLDTAKADDFASDQDQKRNLADTFVSSLQSDLLSLQNVLTDSDTSGMQKLLHTLKGYVTFFCNERFAHQLIDIEANARHMPVEQLRSTIGGLLPDLNAMHQEVNDWRKQLSQQN